MLTMVCLSGQIFTNPKQAKQEVLVGAVLNKTNANMNNKEQTMSAKGQFEINLTPQKDENSEGRMLIDKTYSGDLTGTGIGQMISKRTELGSAVYYAIEEFSGELNGKLGSFTLIHSGVINKESQTLEITVLEGS